MSDCDDHVTRARANPARSTVDLFGHETEHCDAAGCSGDELYQGEIVTEQPAAFFVHKVVLVDELGNPTSELEAA